MYKKEKGFTLIELLVVIAIIAILSTVVMAGLNSARMKGRDAKRVGDVKALQSALDLYLDSCGSYPKNAGAGSLTIGSATGLLTTTTETVDPCLTSGDTFGTFMAALPVNPTPAATQATYDYCSTDATGACSTTEGADYQIKFGLEGTTGALAAGTHIASSTGIQ